MSNIDFLAAYLGKDLLMSLIFKIVRDFHCRSTHHYFAMDALGELQTVQAIRLRGVLLRYYDNYLDGATAPDQRFKDFENHVIWVQDSYWGGAPEKCLEWLSAARQYLNQGRWRKAAFACGVLSHYFTDPIMPLHTTGRESANHLHSALEWSIYQAYPAIYEQTSSGKVHTTFQFSQDKDWIKKAVLAAATLANRHAKRLTESYDPNRVVTNPSFGLTDQSTRILAELFSVAIGGWACVLSRLADEVQGEIPAMDLGLATSLAALDLPLAWMSRRWQLSRGRRSVTKILNELNQTGSVTGNLSQEITTLQNLRSQKGRAHPAHPMKIQSTESSSDERADNSQSTSNTSSQPATQASDQPEYLSLSEARARLNQRILRETKCGI